jgi:hypothetical protein
MYMESSEDEFPGEIADNQNPLEEFAWYVI